MPKIIVFTRDLDFYSEQLLIGLQKIGYAVQCVVDPTQRGNVPKWNSQLDVIKQVPLRGRLDRFAAEQYAESIEFNKPDICLCYTSRALSVALKARRIAGLNVPIVGTRGAVGGISCWHLQDWFSYLNPSLDAVICMSDAIRIRLAHEARRLWPRHPGKFVTIYQGYSSLVPTAKLRDHKSRSTATPRVIACIANERPIKGMGHLLDALEHHLQFENWQLMWIGNVSEATTKRISLSPKLREKVVCLGYRKDARALLAQSDIYIQPTVAPGEGIGNAIAEAMAAQLVVVTSNVGGALELVSAISPELLFESANPASIASVLNRLLNDNSQCETLGRKGTDLLTSKFNLDNEIKQHVALFNQLLRREQRAA